MIQQSGLNDQLILNLGSSLLIGIVMIVISSIALQIYAKEKSRLLLYFFLSWTFFGAFIIVNGISIVTGFILLYQSSYIFVFPLGIIFFFAFIDEVMHEQIGIKKMIVVFTICTLIATFVVLEPWTYDSINADFTLGPTLDWWFLQITNIVFTLDGIAYFYWVAVTFRKVPPMLKKWANGLFILGFIMLVAVVIQYAGNTLLLIIQTLLAVVVTLGTIIIIKKEPRIVHLLPFTVYKLLITSKNGPKYYEKSWAESGIDDDMLSGLISAIGTVAKSTLRMIKTGAISEIKMYKGVMLTEMRYDPINIVLLASKASTALRKALDGFGAEFTKTFYNELYNKEGFAIEVMDSQLTFTPQVMDPLIKKYFGSVPIFIEKGVNDPIEDAIKNEVKPIE